MADRRIKVLICDDSAVVRALLQEIIRADPDFEVVGTAMDPHQAREMIKLLNPDVLTLDVDMPRMDGLEFLSRLMRLRPMAVVMISALTTKGSETALKALELGAVDFIAKPKAENMRALLAYGNEIRDRIRSAYRARVAGPATVREARPAAASALEPRALGENVICIGASTGGTEAIREVLSRLPERCPPVLLVQHMPEMFTQSFARRLDGLCELSVKEAEHGEPVVAGSAYLAPGHSHLRLVRRGGSFHCDLSSAPPVNRHRPSVDVLFHSAAQVAGRRALGVLLTGMGKDGAEGLLAMRNVGAWTVAQDEASCVVYGMPREAARIGAAVDVAALKLIPRRVLDQLAHADSGRAAACLS